VPRSNWLSPGALTAAHVAASAQVMIAAPSGSGTHPASGRLCSARYWQDDAVRVRQKCHPNVILKLVQDMLWRI
jgi:hypothetical protein